jgi:hypothetical protein
MDDLSPPLQIFAQQHLDIIAYVTDCLNASHNYLYVITKLHHGDISDSDRLQMSWELN